ncbi:uncharacterized protein [Polyergus mexicanus]|uniref:uncharacterized protein n=1 Tax=Polyergus mexicanus TaxID=615972 RepID=UPI0038B67101
MHNPETGSTPPDKVDKKGGSDPSVGMVNWLLNADGDEIWITDSSESAQITRRLKWFTDYRELNNGGTISLDNDKECDIVGIGTIPIEKLVDGKWQEARIEEMLYVPDMKKNLFSVGKCTKEYEVSFKDKFVKMTDGNRVLSSRVKH